MPVCRIVHAMDGLSLSGLPASNDPTRVLAHVAAAPGCLPITVIPIPGEAELVSTFSALPRVYVAHQGRGRRWYQRAGRLRALHTAPRMIEIYEAGLRFDRCRWQGQPGRAVFVEFDAARVREMTQGEVEALPLHTHHELFDDRVSRILLELADEMLRGMPNGPLYAQGLSLALIGVLAGSYGTGREPLPLVEPGRFGPAQQRRLIDLVHLQMASDLSLARLALEVGLSPHHFLRVFKATFGTTPHRYVQERRLEAAAEALHRQPQRPIADIALAHGFASQAHMTGLMRRRFGAPPGALRRRG